jgi:preprotein translocase subunit YajC
MTNIWILASAENGEGQVVGMEETTDTPQTATQQDGTNGTAPETDTPSQPGFAPSQFIFLIVIVVIMYMLLFRGPKKKQQEHQKMVSALAKNDRVRTIGGIFGTVLDVRDDEIVLKIDESSNTKMRISPSAVATVLKDTKNQ